MLNVIGGKGKKDRVVPLNSTIRTVLSEYKEAMIKMGYEKDSSLFYGGRGKLKPDAVLRMFYSLSKELDFKVTLHNLRHTFCKNLLSKGVPLNEISDLAGHSSLDITQRYITASLGDLTVSVEKLNEF
ncbi:MAG: site-specific integrase [Bdellovibrionota bacterium]